MQSRHLWAGLALALMAGGCASPQSRVSAPAAAAAGSICRTTSAMIAFDFDGASSSACAVTGERSFDVLVTPEHAPPINPSPWYAFRYETQGDAPVSVTLRYLGGTHRYSPKWHSKNEIRELAVTTGNDGARAMIELPPGQGVVSAQEVITPADARADMQRWAALAGTQVFTLGQSRDGRPVEAIRIGRADAPRLVVLLGRQHPPEVTGAIAMQAFVDQLAAQRGELPGDLQLLIVPMLNPDGVARGHWRANRGGTDLNRDWGDFTQPETRAVKAWLDALPAGVRPVLMIDFHSTGRNLFYVQGDEASPAQASFLAAWLGGREGAFAGWPFRIEPRNANPGSGTAKNWFFATYAIPAYTYEVADTADRPATRAAAQALAASLPSALKSLEE
jgi:hypothetical protein